jgi:superfamily II DNA or RNA helicase
MEGEVPAGEVKVLRVPFDTRAALLAWLERHGIGHVARLNLEALAPYVEPALRAPLKALGGRRRLIDLASLDALSRSHEWLPSHLRERLPPLSWRFLEDEREGAERARASAPERLRAPEDPKALGVHAALCELRSRLPGSVAPRPEPALREGALRVDAALPGFRYEDARPFEPLPFSSGRFIKPEVKLTLTPGAPRAECSCDAGACVHVLAAIDAALLWLQQPASEAFLAGLEELSRPSWERTLWALDRALEQGSPSLRAGVELSFRVRVVDDAGAEVAPWVQRLGKRGQRGAAARLTRRRLLIEYGAVLSPEDARIASLLPENDGFASRALLEALAGHPRAVLATDPERVLQIDRAVVGLVAEERQGAVRVSAGVDGTALPSGLADRVRRARPDEPLFLWDGQRLTLLDVKSELKTLLGVLAREGGYFPPESHAALLRSLAKWAGHLPVAMPRSVMGESVPPLLSPVLRLEAQVDGSVEVELRVRPLADSASFVPGQGVRDVHVRRGEKAVHAVRDLRAEEAAFKELAADLPLFEAEVLDGFFRYRLPTAQGALGLLEACSQRDPAPELEWVGAPLRAAGKRGPRALRVVVERRHEWFGVLGGLNVEGERVELARLLDAARRNERYVQIADRSYVELSEELLRRLDALAAHARPSRQGVEVGPSGAEALRALEADGAAFEADAAFRQLVGRIAAAGALAPAAPVALRAELRPYQLEGFRWLSRLAAWGAGGILADDMGLGKTVQTLALLLARADEGPALVVAPTSVAFNWADEARRFAPSLRLALYADAADRDQALSGLGPGDVLVVSYGLLARDAGRLAARRFATVVFDEAQHLKNATTRRFRAARGLDGGFRVALSGTPIENHLGELWALFAVSFPALLGGWQAFRRRYAAPIEKQDDPDAAAALARVIGPFLLRRTKAQVEAELPARTEVRVPVVLSSAEWQLYEDARLAALSDLETRKSKMREQERRVEVLAALTRLRLLASHPRLYDERCELASAKLSRLLGLVDELRAEGQRALVFSQFTSHLALVREALEARGVAYVYLDGRTPAGERGELVRAFQEGDAPLFLISLKAGGFGLNLTAATNVVHLDPWWNPAVEDQASDRVHRLGQLRPVTVYRLVAMGTIEEQMLSLHATKRSLVARVLDGKDEATKLSTDDLLGLLSRAPPPAAPAALLRPPRRPLSARPREKGGSP